MIMSEAIAADYLEDQYAFLDDCPQELLEHVICSTVGTLEQRSRTMQQWYKYLMAGELPPKPDWLPSYISENVEKQLKQADVARFMKDQHELTVQLLQDVMQTWHLVQYEYQQQLAEWQAQQREKFKNLKRINQPIDDTDFTDHFNFSGELVINEAWNDKVQAWKKLDDVFGDLSNMLGRDVNLTKGILKHQNWRHIERLQELLKRISEFKKIVDSLGRLQESIANDEVLESFFESISRVVEEIQEKVVHYIPEEMSGIERSGNIARMLPQEALFLGHPQLKMLWHARRYEQALLSYRVQGTEISKTWAEINEQVEVQKPRPRFDRGPILVVLDTSGSMSGEPELVAKALTLQAAKTAHAEKRPCYLFAFSGRGDKIEYELKLNQSGIQGLLEFLGCSFSGGTDIETVEHAIQRLDQEQWKKADVMIVSDGQWSASSHIRTIVEKSKKDGTRYHGIQVGYAGGGLEQLCNSIHRFASWSKLR